MSEFIQIMRFRSDDLDTLKKETDEYRETTAGRSTYTSEIMGRDLDTGEYVIIVRFPSKEAADVNNALPETNAMAEKMASYVSEGPSFANIEVLETNP